MMLHTYEALLQPNGQLQFLDPPVEASLAPRRVLVTFTDKAVVEPSAVHRPVTSWERWVGVLKDSPVFEGDPVAIQRAMRDEWN